MITQAIVKALKDWKSPSRIPTRYTIRNRNRPAVRETIS